MIPSLEMMQTFLQIRFKERAVKIVPVIGVVPLEYIKQNALTDTRVLSLPFPGISLPRKADQQEAPRDWYHVKHDWYHCLVASCGKSKQRKAFAFLAENVLKPLEIHPELASIHDFISVSYQLFLDMEFSQFRDEIKDYYAKKYQWNENHLFWRRLITYFRTAIKALTKHLSSCEMDEKILFYLNEIKKTHFYNLFFEEVFKYKKEIEENYEISFEALRELGEQKIKRKNDLGKSEELEFCPLISGLKVCQKC